MAEVTRVPLRPIAGGSLVKLWLGVIVAVLLAGGIAWASTPKGLSVDEISAGEGPYAQIGDVAFVRYTGSLENGEIFDPGNPPQWPVPGILPDGTPMLLQEGALIPGFLTALQETQKGGVYEIFIPSDQAYGDTPPPEQPEAPTGNLLFRVEVVEIMPMEEAQQRFAMIEQLMMQAQAGAEGGENTEDPPSVPAE